MPPSKARPANRALIVVTSHKAATFEVTRILGLREQVRAQFKGEMTELDGWAGKDPDFDDLASDVASELEAIRVLALQMLVVALYRVVELSTVRLLKCRWEEEDIRRWSLYRVDKLRTALKQELQIDLKSLAEYASVDELRCLNNAIKHQGVVSAPLVKYGWSKGEPIGDCDNAIDRLHVAVPNYIKALADIAIPK